MKRLSPTLFATALASLLIASSPARADFINWSYNWDRAPSTIGADVLGSGGMNLTNEPTNNAIGSTVTVATNLRTFSTAPAGSPATFTNTPYSLAIQIIDAASLSTGTLVFSGMLNGTLSTSNSNVTNTFTGATTQSLVLGDHTYDVTIGPFAPPGLPSSTNSGSISAFVAVSGPGGTPPPPGEGPPPPPVGNPPPPVSNQPEPSTALLSCLGVSFLGLASWRRRKNCRAAA